MDKINHGIDSQEILSRAAPKHAELNDRFQLPMGGARNYDSQFFSMYTHRTEQLSPRVAEAAVKKWGNGDKVIGDQTIKRQEKILDIVGGQLSWVVGTVFIEMSGKLNILRDVEKGLDDILPKQPDDYTGEEDVVYMLEDESGRAILAGDYLSKGMLVTGCVVGILGMEVRAGVFEVMDVVYPTKVENKAILSESSDTSVILLSGIGIDESSDDIQLELLKQYITGELGLVTQSSTAAKVSRVIILGDSIKSEPTARDSLSFGSKNVITYNPESIVKLQQFVHELALSVPVSIMPGSRDPAEICLPQQPLHRSIFRSTLAIQGGGRLERLTNPQWLEENGTSILATAGQNVDDVRRYNPGLLSTIDVMERNLRWQHIAPTAPDTLYCYAYTDDDPFILDKSPEIYVVGNQEEYSEKEVDGVLLVSVPRFTDRGELVVLKGRKSEVITITV